MTAADFATARAPARRSATCPPKVSGDRSYRDALGVAAWCRLKPEIRRRFSVQPASGAAIRYAGTMRKVALSLTGWLFAQVCRLIGTPLAPYRGEWVPMWIELVDDPVLAGVAWNRTYRFEANRDFTVCSTKCRGEGSEFFEHIGCGFRMRLVLTEVDGNLWFVSKAYEVSVMGRHFEIPSLLTPGVTTVKHEQLTGDRFRFSLAVVHPWFGRTIYQEGIFYSVNER